MSVKPCPPPPPLPSSPPPSQAGQRGRSKRSRRSKRAESKELVVKLSAELFSAEASLCLSLLLISAYSSLLPLCCPAAPSVLPSPRSVFFVPPAPPAPPRFSPWRLLAGVSLASLAPVPSLSLASTSASKSMLSTSAVDSTPKGQNSESRLRPAHLLRDLRVLLLRRSAASRGRPHRET